MPDQTPRGYPYPLDNSDPPDGGAQIQALAIAIDTDVGTIDDRTSTTPRGDSSNSVTLTSADKRLTGSAQTVILTTSIVLDRQQWIGLQGKARVDNSGGATGAVGVHIAVDGTPIQLSHAGPIDITNTGATRTQLNTGTFSVLLAAGAHTIEFRADRDGTGQLDAIASGGLSTGPTYHPTSLTVTI